MSDRSDHDTHSRDGGSGDDDADAYDTGLGSTRAEIEEDLRDSDTSIVDIDALLEWSDALDYDAYHADWMSLATSSRPTEGLDESHGAEPYPY